MKRFTPVCCLILLGFLVPTVLVAGVYRGSILIRTQVITHPIGYDGTGGPLPVAVCVRPGDEVLKPFVEDALAIWNDLTSTIGNCAGCITTEEFANMPGPPPPLFDLQGTVIHEMGHCGLGVEHTTWDVTSVSNARDATSFRPCNITPCPPDAIPGDSDDIVFPVPPNMTPARIVHWFKADPNNTTNANNPFAIDSTVIDEDTFTRARFRLPSGHTWVTNANRRVGDRLGFPNTHAVMYATAFSGEQIMGLTADDVSTVQMSRTGRDKMAGTADDYAAVFSLVEDCQMAEIEFRWVPGSMDSDLGEGALGVCLSLIEPIPGEVFPQQHYRVVGAGTNRAFIKVNSELTWRELTPSVFLDGFESGDTSGWSSVVP